MQPIRYDPNLERLLKEQGEQAESLGILHRLAHEKFNLYSNSINIPVIIGSSAIGFATGIDINYEDINIVLGILSVTVGIIKAIDSYFQLAQRSERHRLVSLQYAQICRKISVELSLERDVRMDAKDMLGIIRTDIKNLEEIAPIIPDDVIAAYKQKYPKHDGETIKRPAITNGLTEIIVNTPEDNEMRSRRITHDLPDLPDLHVSAELVHPEPVVPIVDVPMDSVVEM